MNSTVPDNSSQKQPDADSSKVAQKPGANSANPPESGSRWIVFGAVALVFLPVLFHSCRGESNRWRAAAVMERYLDGEKEQAIEELQALSEQLPLDYRIKLTLASWQFENYQAEQALELLDQLPEPMHSKEYMALRRNCLLALNRGDEAIQVFRQANPANADRVGFKLLEHKNSLAYFAALAGRELPLSLQNANYVIASRSNEWAQRHELQLNARLQTLLCTTLIYRNEINRIENDQTAKTLAEEKSLEVLSDVIEDLHTAYSDCCNSSGEHPDKEHDKEIRDSTAAALAIFHTTRALIYQDLFRFANSVEDREVVRTLGFMPEEIAERLPNFDECVGHARTMASILDTRGCVFLRLFRHQSAMADLSTAIVAQQALVEIADHSDRTREEASLDPRQQNEKFVLQPRKALAIFIYHRSWIWEALGKRELAFRILLDEELNQAIDIRFDGVEIAELENQLEQQMPLKTIRSFELEKQDLQRVRELGFKPGPYLF